MSGRAIYKDILAFVDYDKSRKPVILERNTVRYWLADGTMRVRLHHTDIITVSPDGAAVTLYMGGYNSRTTRDRISSYAPGCRISTKDGESYLGTRRGLWPIDSYDRITIVDGLPGATPAARRAALQEYAARRRRELHLKTFGRHVLKRYDAALVEYRAAVKRCARISARCIIKPAA